MKRQIFSRWGRQVVAWFQAQRLGVLVVREIRSALRNAKLVTVPDFEVAYIDQRIKLKAPQPPETVFKIIVTEENTAADSLQSAVVGGSVPDPAPRIGMLKAVSFPRSLCSVMRPPRCVKYRAIKGKEYRLPRTRS